MMTAAIVFAVLSVLSCAMVLFAMWAEKKVRRENFLSDDAKEFAAFGANESRLLFFKLSALCGLLAIAFGALA